MYNSYYLGKIKNININDNQAKYVLVKESINPKAFLSIKQEVFKYKDINTKEAYKLKNLYELFRIDKKLSLEELAVLKSVVNIYRLKGLTAHGKNNIKKIGKIVNKTYTKTML